MSSKDIERSLCPCDGSQVPLMSRSVVPVVTGVGLHLRVSVRFLRFSRFVGDSSDKVCVVVGIVRNCFRLLIANWLWSVG